MAFVLRQSAQLFGVSARLPHGCRHQGHLALTPDTSRAAGDIADPPGPPSNSSDHPNESTDTASPSPTAFSDNSTEKNGTPGESFQLQSLLEQPPSDDSVPDGRHGCLSQSPAAETATRDAVATPQVQMQAFLDDIDRRLRSGSDTGEPHDEGNANKKTTEDATNHIREDNDASDRK